MINLQKRSFSNRNKMKPNRKILNCLLIGILSLLCSSCSDIDFYPDYWNGGRNEVIATIIPIEGTDSCIFEFDGKYMFAVNYQTTEYDHKVRAFIRYEKVGQNIVMHYGLRCYEIRILDIQIITSSDVSTNPDAPSNPEDPPAYDPPLDSVGNDTPDIPTDPPVTNPGDGTDIDVDELYGCDPISFYHPGNYNKVCYTHIADGFLHLHVIIPVGDIGCTHEINLIPYVPVKGEPAIPYHFELRHKQTGPHEEYDPETSIIGETVVAFDIGYLRLSDDDDYITIHTDNAMSQLEVRIYYGQQPIL